MDWWPLDPDRHHTADPEINQLVELRTELARLELRLTKWTVICAMVTVSLVVAVGLPALKGAALLVFLLCSAGQIYAISRM